MFYWEHVAVSRRRLPAPGRRCLKESRCTLSVALPKMPSAGGFENSGIAAGLGKGHQVTRFTGSDGLAKKNSKPKHRKGVRCAPHKPQPGRRGGSLLPRLWRLLPRPPVAGTPAPA